MKSESTPPAQAHRVSLRSAETGAGREFYNLDWKEGDPPYPPPLPDPYPGGPGATPGTGSEAGAEQIMKRLGTLTERALAFFRSRGRGPDAIGATNPELTIAIKEKDVTAWPRTTHLQKLGKVIPTDRKKKNPESGVRCRVYRATTDEEEAQILEDRRRQIERKFARDISIEALEAAAKVIEALDLGGLFLSQSHIAMIIQKAIDQAQEKGEKR